MRKLLFVHGEEHLERAVREVQDFLDFEQRLTTGSEVSDLVAVLFLSLHAANELLSLEQHCGLRRSANRNALFEPDSTSVNGIWTLVTLRTQNSHESRTRDEEVGRVLDILHGQGIVRDAGKPFYVSLSRERGLTVVG